jgi:hypothetical protein
MELPPSAYSTEDLEKWVLRRLRADAFWDGVGQAKFSNWTVQSQHALPYFCPRLLPGGRWMIGMREGKLFALDLDSGESPRERLLIDPGYEEEYFGERTEQFLQWAYWLDRDHPHFSARITISNSASGMFNENFWLNYFSSL